VPRVGAIGLGALLVPPPRRRLGRLGEMDLGADRAQFLGDEAPTRRRSSATSSCCPAKRLKNRRTSPRSASEIRPRPSSPVSVSIHSAVI
jgi:hypothetical protein